MTPRLFPLRLLTPREVREERVALLRLRDASGHFAIEGGHEDFLTALEPGLGYWRDGEGRRTFLAADGGILTVRAGVAALAAREIFAHEDPEELVRRMEQIFARRDASERALREMLGSLGQAFLRKSLALARGR